MSSSSLWDEGYIPAYSLKELLLIFERTSFVSPFSGSIARIMWWKHAIGVYIANFAVYKFLLKVFITFSLISGRRKPQRPLRLTISLFNTTNKLWCIMLEYSIPKRNSTIDILKGIGITLMVYGHSSGPHHRFFYLFHMAIFIIASGYCFKEQNIVSFGNMICFFKKK